jgi:hypothetical protein
MEAGPHVTDAYAYRQVAEHIDLIVQTSMRTDGDYRRPERVRRVSEVIAVEPGESGGPATTTLWAADPGGGPAVAGALPAALVAGLVLHGYRPGRPGGYR